MNWIRKPLKKLGELLFSYGSVGQWMRFLVILVFLILLYRAVNLANVGMTGFSNFISEVVRPTSNAILDVIRKILFNPPTTAPPPGILELPRLTLINRLELLFTSSFVFDIVQWFVLFVLPSSLSLMFAVLYFNHLHRIDKKRVGGKFLLRFILPFPWKKFLIKEGHVIYQTPDVPLDRIGGPARIDIRDENVAIFEKDNGEVHIIQPGQKQEVIDGYERLRMIVDLRPQSVKFDLITRTKDGILVQACDVIFEYQIFMALDKPSEQSSENTKRLEKLIYNCWVGQNWDKPEKRQADILNMVQVELSRYVSQQPLVEFLSCVEGFRSEPTWDEKEVNPFYRFVEVFNKREKVIRLTWRGDGKWILLSDLQLTSAMQMSNLELVLNNKIRTQRSYYLQLKEKVIDKERNRLILTTIFEPYQRLKNYSTDDILKGLIIVFRQNLTQILNSQDQIPPDRRQEANLVINHLKQLS